MASYKVLVKRSAEKELRSIPPPFLKRIIDKIGKLASSPRPVGSELLTGEERYFRLRQGDYRIVYEIDDVGKKMTVIKIGHRREIYRG